MDTGTIDPILGARFGADIRPKDWAQVSLDRVGSDPLTFTGSQIASHWMHLYDGTPVRVTLWQSRTTAFVVGFSVWGGAEIQSDCVAVDSLTEAIMFLEDCCTVPQAPAPASGSRVDCLLHDHKAGTFNQAFASLVGEALAVWMDLDDDRRWDKKTQRPKP